MAALWIGGLESHREGGRIVKAIGSGFDGDFVGQRAEVFRGGGHAFESTCDEVNGCGALLRGSRRRLA